MKVDMSSEAITRRLRQVDQLRELSLSLMNAKKVSDEKKKLEEEQTPAKSKTQKT
jgi:hypothetical protein